MHKPTVYLDSNIFSTLHGHAKSTIHLARELRTKEWWRLERGHFELWTSMQTEYELDRGDYFGKDRARALARRTRYLQETTEVEKCTLLYLKQGLVPDNKIGDGIQLAIATVHRIDYLLTWNYAHLANARVQASLIELNEKYGWRSPWLVSPDTIPWVTLGQEVRRKDEKI